MDILATYLRLSMDEGEEEESRSISGQRKLIHSYISQDSELSAMETTEFCDDGYSGTSMDRPGMQEMLKQIRANRIRCVIVKDLSRFSRDYIELGTYMNQIFPFMNVRFIAINDHYDSNEHTGMTAPIDTTFKTLLYDLYSKDISVKVSSAFRNKCEAGEYVFGQVPFGYEKNREIKNQVIVNEREAQIVRHIFSLALSGQSSTQIARILNEGGVPTANQMRHPEWSKSGERAQAWSHSTVRKILNNRFYLGEMTYGRTKRKFVGSKNGVTVPKEEWKVMEDHHEALVTQEIYDKVSSFRPDIDNKRKREKNPLTGKLICGGCGYAMIYKPLRGKNRHRRFECSKHGILQMENCCTYFSADILEETVLTMLHKELMIHGDAQKQGEELISFQESRIRELERRLSEINSVKEKRQNEMEALYEKYRFGEMTSGIYRQEADSLKGEINELSEQEKEKQIELDALCEEHDKIGEDMKQMIRFSHFETLTQEMVDVFVKKIRVYKGKKVEIEWNFRASVET